MKNALAALDFDESEEAGRVAIGREPRDWIAKYHLPDWRRAAPDRWLSSYHWYDSPTLNRAPLATLSGCVSQLEKHDSMRHNLLQLWYGLSDQPLERELTALVDEWKRMRPGISSSIVKLVMHPAYQRIIGKGNAAVPFLLRQVQNDPDHWFWALTAITGEDPVPEEERGDLNAMARWWIEWGQQNGYL